MMKQLLTKQSTHRIEEIPLNSRVINRNQDVNLSAKICRSSANNNRSSAFLAFNTKEQGFTLIELLTVVLVAAVILVFAIPSFEGVINNNRVVSAANELTTTLARARLAAVKSNSNTQVKPTTGTDWSSGYQVEADLDGDSTNEVISIVEAVEDNVTFFSSTTSVTFNSLGGLGSTLYPTSATFIETFTLNAPKAYGRTLSISATGSTTIQVNPNTN